LFTTHPLIIPIPKSVLASLRHYVLFAEPVRGYFLEKNEKLFPLCPILSPLPNWSSAFSQNPFQAGVFVRFLLGFFNPAYR
jgi:hypothetical protein